MKRRDIVKRIGVEARRRQVEWVVACEGANHTVYRLGRTMIPIPRHNEMNEITTEGIFKQAEPELGRRWGR